jgi:TolA-binding protein
MKLSYIITASAMLFMMLASARADTDRQFGHALGAFKSGNFGSAELLFKKIIDSGDDDYMDRAWFFYARSIYHQKKYKSAIFEFNNFVNKSRTMSLSTESRFWMGECFYHMKEPVKAIEEYNRFITIGTGSKLVPSAHDRIASIYYIQNRYDEAIIEWNASISKSKNKIANAHRVFRIGDALFREKKYDESLQRLYPLITARVDKVRPGPRY